MQRIQHDQHSAAERKVRHIIPWVVFFFVLMLFATLTGTLFFRVFVVRSVVCTFDKNPCPEPIMAEFQHVMGESLAFASLDASSIKIKAAMPQVSDINIHKQFPSTIQVKIVGSNIACAVYASPEKGYFLLSDEAKISGKVESRPQGLVLLQLPGRGFVLGDQMDENMTGFCRDIERSAVYSSISAIEWREAQEIALYLTSGKTALASTKDLILQLGTLQRFLGEATMIERVSIIDLRFSHPVLR